jgi:hypothetical protein
MTAIASVVPYVVVRANNLPLASLADLMSSDDMARSLAALDGARATLAVQRDHVCTLLYGVAAQGGPDYRRLIDARRALLKADALAGVLARHGELLGRHAAGRNWIGQARLVLDREAAVLALFAPATAAARRAARALVAQPVFLQALGMARGDMHRLATGYAQRPDAAGKKALNDEETLFRYLTRAITKVSPFSSFTSVGFAALREGAVAAPVLAPHRQREDRFSLDRSALLKLFECFLLRHPAHWSFRLTSNHRDTNGERHYYLFADRPELYPYRTSLLTTRFPAAAVLAGRDGAHDWVTWATIERRLPPGAAGRATLKKWLAAGMVNYHPRLDDESADLLGDFLAIARAVAAADVTARPVAVILEHARASLRALPEAGPEAARSLVADLNAALQALSGLLDWQLVKRDGLVYHDSYLPDLPPLSAARVTACAGQLGEFIDHYLGVNFNSGYPDAVLAALRTAMRDGAAMSVFDFHELVQQTMASHAGEAARPEQRTMPLIALYEQIWARRDEAEIVLAPVPVDQGARAGSFAAYGHLTPAGFVVNNIDSGYLRCYSRFLTFPRSPVVLDACRAAYGTALSDAHDIYDTFGFNTAHRPRLCRHRLWLDTPHTAGNGDLPLSALRVRWPGNAPYPVLSGGPDDAPVRLRQTGLFVKELYPRLLETLMRFAMAGEPCYFAFRFGLHKLVAERSATGPVRFPRIRYRDLVLSREQWWIARAALPQRALTEDAPAYFLRLNTWRHETGLPQRVFMRRHHAGKVLDRDISNTKKPVLLDFASPLMARMIGRMFGVAFDLVSFEEALPDVTTIDPDQYASEIILETTPGPEMDTP